MLVGTERDLIARINSIYAAKDTKPLAILCGSGVSSSVLASTEMIVENIRRQLDHEDKQDLDDALASLASTAEKYQAAFDFLALRRSPAERDRVITMMTLGAYKGLPKGVRPSLTDENLSLYEADNAQWKVPRGIEALGRIWAGTRAEKRGPILTSNFDPLCEIALRRAGSQVSTRVVDADGSIYRDFVVAYEPHVVHFHGYWRGSSTLSMNSQLGQERPALQSGLRLILQNYSLLVLGYSGWNDVLMRQLLSAIRAQEATSLDVMWCSYTDVSHETLSESPAIRELAKAPGNVIFYANIDSNTFLPSLEKRIAAHLDYPGKIGLAGSKVNLVGWEPIPQALTLAETEAKTEALSFFDGRLPNWNDAHNPYIPLRAVTSSAVNQLRHVLATGESSLSTLIGPSGEGKSIALRQIAAAIAREDRSDVVLQHHSDAGLESVEAVLDLPVDKSHVLFVDNAGRCVDKLRLMTERLNSIGRRRIHLVCASRDSDWISAGGSNFAWDRHVRVYAHRVRGVDRLDAAAIVDAWSLIGNDALGDLAAISGREDRIRLLMSSARDHTESGDGALLGALLDIRYGANLEQHVVEMMKRLANWAVPGAISRLTLLDAFVMIALPHASGVHSLSQELLARATGTTADELAFSVLHPLGEEAAINFSRAAVMVRHSRIARVAADHAGSVNSEPSTAIQRLVAAAVSLIEEGGELRKYAPFAYWSGKLETLNSDLAVVAAEAAAEASPRRLSYKSSLSKALRRADRVSAACKVNEDAMQELGMALDLDGGARPFLTEWGVAEGSRGNYGRNIVLASAALCDSFKWGPLRRDQAAAALYCLATAFRRRYEDGGDIAFARGALGVLEIVSSPQLKNEARDGWNNQLDDWVERNRIGGSLDHLQAVNTIRTALSVALGNVESPLPASVQNGSFKFSELTALAR